MARKKIIAGNWKMNMTPSQAVELVNTLKPLVVNDEVDVVFCVPAIDLAGYVREWQNLLLTLSSLYNVKRSLDLSFMSLINIFL